MKSTNAATPIIVGALALASIVSAALFVTTQGKATSSIASTRTQTATKETTGQSTPEATGAQATGNPTPSTSANTSNTTSVGGYKDGTYSASASYSVPHGINSIGVSMTVKNGTITALKTSHDYGDRESGIYVDSFDSRIQSLVVGKPLGDTSLSRVGGASLTTFGFEDALATITNEARA